MVAQGLAVGPAERHGVVGVGDAHRAGHEGDRLAREAVRVAAAVPVLVVVAHAEHEVVGEQGAQDVGGEDRVLAHELPFFGVQRHPA